MTMLKGASSYRLGKKEAMHRLLLQAVKLHFDEADPLAVNLILVSAFRIGRDLVKRRRPHDEIFQTLIKPEMLGMAMRKLAEVANFLKHAEKDSDDALEVPETLMELNEMLLFIAINYYELAFDETIRNFFIHMARLYVGKKNPNILTWEADSDRTLRLKNYLDELTVDELFAHIRRLVQDPSARPQMKVESHGWTWA